MKTEPNIAGVILAAGLSKRMGRPKQGLPLAGKPILRHVIEAAEASRLRETVVVLGAGADEIAALVQDGLSRSTRFVVNEEYRSGQASSLQAGLQALAQEVEAAAVLVGDQPGISSGLIDRVIEAFVDSGRPIARPVFAEGGSAVPGHPVILARSVWPAVLRLKGDEGARQLIRARPEDVFEVAIAGPAPADVDTEEDYRRLRTERGS
jgi:molybdenum cofactor cytidylyltransferase